MKKQNFKKNKSKKYFDDSEEILKIKENTNKLLNKAKCREAIKFLRAESKKYPNSFYIKSMLAVLPAEEAFTWSERKMKIAYKNAARAVRPLLRKMRGASLEQRFRNRNEYYWFSQQHKKQYQLGIKMVQQKFLKGYYAQGVGAVNYAYRLMSEKKMGLSIKWAIKAEKAWISYFEQVSRTSWEPWIWYALARGLQGDFLELERSLVKSAKLSGLNLKIDPTFQKIRKMSLLGKKVSTLNKG